MAAFADENGAGAGRGGRHRTTPRDPLDGPSWVCSIEDLAGVDIDGCSGDAGGLPRGEEEDGVGHLVLSHHAPQGHLCDMVGQHLVVRDALLRCGICYPTPEDIAPYQAGG